MAQFPKLFNIPENYPAQISSEVGFETVQFIKNAPFQVDYWQLWKRIYKLCETYAIENPQALDTSPDLANALMQALVRIDHAESDEKNKYPTWKTVLYMKRRGRRLLKFLAQNAPDTYINFSLRLLESTPTQNIEQGYLESQRWLSYYIVYAKSRQIIQKNVYDSYVADWSKFQYNTIQTHAHEIWDNPKYTNQIIALWHKTDKMDIFEWLYYWHKRNNIAFPKFSDAQLIMFFETENSSVLHHLATQQTYQLYAMQGLSANLHAYMYFYASHSLRKKIDQIRQIRPKMDDFWQKFWGESYAKVTISALKNDNKGRRVEKALELLVNNYKPIIDKLSESEIFELAPSLFAMQNPKLQEIAFLKLKNVNYSNVSDWINAWNNPNRNPNNQKDIASFERLLDVAMPIYKKHDVYQYYNVVSSFFKGDYFMVLFGVKIAVYAEEWEVANILSEVTNFLEADQTKKRELAQKNLTLLFSTNEGINLFLRLFRYSDSTPNSYPVIYWEIAEKCNATKIVTYFDEILINLMNSDMLNHLSKLYKAYPNVEDAQKYILDKCKDFTKSDLLYPYNIYNVRQIVINPNQTAEFRTFADKMFWFAFHNIRLGKSNASGCFEYGNIYCPQDANAFYTLLWKNIPLLSAKKQQHFINALNDEDKLHYFYDNAKYIPDDFYQKVIENTTYKTTIEFINKLDEESWKKGAKFLLARFFELGNKEQGFWENLLPQIASNLTLGKRLFQNPIFVQFFQSQKNPELLNISLPEYEEILFDWLWNNTDILPMDSQNLFKACLHKLPSLRKFALNYATKQGLTTYFTLKLLESDMPDAMRTAQEHIQNIDPSDKFFLENVLAICDSPHRNTRKFAESILLKHKNILLEKYDILNYLYENSDVTIQNFVAKILIDTPKNQNIVPKETPTQRFTQEIFRQTNRNRQTKEILKKDVSLLSNVALLEIARTGTPKDKEWAIAQLTLKAIAGEKIEGFFVEI